MCNCRSHSSPRNTPSGTVQNVGLISDTHIPVRSKELPSEVLNVFAEVDLIIHAGDLVDISVIDRLKQLSPVLAVYGNMDSTKVRRKLPRMTSTRVFDWKIGVIHTPQVLLGKKKMWEIAEENQLDVLVHGHTHNSNIQRSRGVLFINPGSTTTDLPPFVKNPSVALLKITQNKIKPKIVYLKNFFEGEDILFRF